MTDLRRMVQEFHHMRKLELRGRYNTLGTVRRSLIRLSGVSLWKQAKAAMQADDGDEENSGRWEHDSEAPAPEGGATWMKGIRERSGAGNGERRTNFKACGESLSAS